MKRGQCSDLANLPCKYFSCDTASVSNVRCESGACATPGVRRRPADSVQSPACSYQNKLFRLFRLRCILAPLCQRPRALRPAAGRGLALVEGVSTWTSLVGALAGNPARGHRLSVPPQPLRPASSICLARGARNAQVSRYTCRFRSCQVLGVPLESIYLKSIFPSQKTSSGASTRQRKCEARPCAATSSWTSGGGWFCTLLRARFPPDLIRPAFALEGLASAAD